MNSEEEISLFLRTVDQVRQLEFVANPAYQNQNLNVKMEREGEGFKLSITPTLPPADSVRSFMLGFRKFLLKKERTNFGHVCDLVHKSDYPQRVKNIVSLMRKAYGAVEAGRAIPVKFNKGAASPDRLIDLYFNGELFHSDEQKVREIESIKGTPNEPLYWFLLVSGCTNLFMLISNVATALRRADDEEFLEEMERSSVEYCRRIQA